MTKKVWSNIFTWLGANVDLQFDVVSNFMKLGGLIKGKRRKGIKHLIWAVVVWKIWTARNKVLFKGEVVNVKSIINSIIYTSWGWFVARRGCKCGLAFSNQFNCPIGYLLFV